jgi:hypothetical protein
MCSGEQAHAAPGAHASDSHSSAPAGADKVNISGELADIGNDIVRATEDLFIAGLKAAHHQLDQATITLHHWLNDKTSH